MIFLFYHWRSQLCLCLFSKYFLFTLLLERHPSWCYHFVWKRCFVISKRAPGRLHEPPTLFQRIDICLQLSSPHWTGQCQAWYLATERRKCWSVEIARASHSYGYSWVHRWNPYGAKYPWVTYHFGSVLKNTPFMMMYTWHKKGISVF